MKKVAVRARDRVRPADMETEDQVYECKNIVYGELDLVERKDSMMQ